MACSMAGAWTDGRERETQSVRGKEPWGGGANYLIVRASVLRACMQMGLDWMDAGRLRSAQ